MRGGELSLAGGGQYVAGEEASGGREAGGEAGEREREGEARWDYSRDFEQCICSRGMTVSFYEEGLGERARKRASERKGDREQRGNGQDWTRGAGVQCGSPNF